MIIPKVKPIMTPLKQARILKSVQFIMTMAEMIKIEHMNDLIDGEFKNGQANQFARRIFSDANAIQNAVKSQINLNLSVSDNDFVEEYSCELYRVFQYFAGLPLSQVKEVMDNLHKASVIIHEPND